MLKGILAISGQPGLYKLVTEAKNSIIVESMLTGKRMPVYSTSKVSSLEDIAIFTQTGEVSLKEVLKNIAEKKNRLEVTGVDSGSQLKAFFGEVLPDYDQGRVYTSDMKKVVQWYNLLVKNELLNFDEGGAAEETKAE